MKDFVYMSDNFEGYIISDSDTETKPTYRLGFAYPSSNFTQDLIDHGLAVLP